MIYDKIPGIFAWEHHTTYIGKAQNKQVKVTGYLRQMENFVQIMIFVSQ